MTATTHYRTSRKVRALRPVFGLAAAFAAVATLGLAVVAPAAMPPAASAHASHADARAAARVPTEVAILPGTIEVVATRTRAAAAAPGQYQPTTWRPRG